MGCALRGSLQTGSAVRLSGAVPLVPSAPLCSAAQSTTARPPGPCPPCEGGALPACVASSASTIPPQQLSPVFCSSCLLAFLANLRVGTLTRCCILCFSSILADDVWGDHSSPAGDDYSFNRPLVANIYSVHRSCLNKHMDMHPRFPGTENSNT